MPSFSAPLEVTDQNGTTGTIIGPQGVVGSNQRASSKQIRCSSTVRLASMADHSG